MDIKVSQEGRATVISASGKIDAMTAPALESTLSDLVGEGKLCLALDLGDIEYISSAGLRVILAIAKSLKGKSGMLLLANARGPVQEVFEISGFGSVFNIYDSIEDALKAAD